MVIGGKVRSREICVILKMGLAVDKLSASGDWGHFAVWVPFAIATERIYIYLCALISDSRFML